MKPEGGRQWPWHWVRAAWRFSKPVCSEKKEENANEPQVTKAVYFTVVGKVLKGS